MSFNIILKKCISENNKIGKEFADNGITLVGNLRGECTIIDPQIVIEIDSNMVADCNISVYNYAEISIFARKYFIKSMTVGPYNVNPITNVKKCLWTLNLHCDVLDSYKPGILNCNAMVEKNEEIESSNLYINDSTFYTEQRGKITTHHFMKNGSPFEFSEVHDNYVLAIVGN